LRDNEGFGALHHMMPCKNKKKNKKKKKKKKKIQFTCGRGVP
jgi:hypothetical protein